MTLPYSPRRVRLRDKRADRAKASRARTDTLWQRRFTSTESAEVPPVARADMAYSLARTRMTQAVKRADAKITRTRGQPRQKARTEAAAIRIEVIADVTRLITEMQAIADRYDKPRTPQSRKDSEAMWLGEIGTATDPMALWRVTKKLLHTRCTAYWRAAARHPEAAAMRIQMAGELEQLATRMLTLAGKYHKPRV